jgi:hypothetical protein
VSVPHHRRIPAQARIRAFQPRIEDAADNLRLWRALRRKPDDVAIAGEHGNQPGINEDGVHVRRRDVKHQAPRRTHRLGRVQPAEFLAQPHQFRLAHPEGQCLQFRIALSLGIPEKSLRELRAELHDCIAERRRRARLGTPQPCQHFDELPLPGGGDNLLNHHAGTMLA